MCLWCGHTFSNFVDGCCDPGGWGRDCGCTITEKMQDAWQLWIEAERPGRWTKEDWKYIMENYGE